MIMISKATMTNTMMLAKAVNFVIFSFRFFKNISFPPNDYFTFHYYVIEHETVTFLFLHFDIRWPMFIRKRKLRLCI